MIYHSGVRFVSGVPICTDQLSEGCQRLKCKLLLTEIYNPAVKVPSQLKFALLSSFMTHMQKNRSLLSHGIYFIARHEDLCSQLMNAWKC